MKTAIVQVALVLASTACVITGHADAAALFGFMFVASVMGPLLAP